MEGGAEAAAADSGVRRRLGEPRGEEGEAGGGREGLHVGGCCC